MEVIRAYVCVGTGLQLLRALVTLNQDEVCMLRPLDLLRPIQTKPNEYLELKWPESGSNLSPPIPR
jgi:hypothetical protein